MIKEMLESNDSEMIDLLIQILINDPTSHLHLFYELSDSYIYTRHVPLPLNRIAKKYYGNWTIETLLSSIKILKDDKRNVKQ